MTKFQFVSYLKLLGTLTRHLYKQEYIFKNMKNSGTPFGETSWDNTAASTVLIETENIFTSSPFQPLSLTVISQVPNFSNRLEAKSLACETN